MSTKELLVEYNNCTLKAIKLLEQDEDIEGAVESREAIINQIKSCGIDQNIGNSIADELNIFENEKKLNKLITDKKIEIKNEIDLIKKRRMARQNYSNLSSKPVFFNKKV